MHIKNNVTNFFGLFYIESIKNKRKQFNRNQSPATIESFMKQKEKLLLWKT